MKILCITHADFETPGVIEIWAQNQGHQFTISKPYKGEHCLSHTDFDALIIMGGPQSASSFDEFLYLRDEVALIKTAITNNKVVIGFCLGAQLIGETLGAPTEKSPEKEIGVFEITLTTEGYKDPLLKGFESHFPAIHWHNDMPGQTSSSVILASSAGCPRQIIRYADRVYGFQCHLEIDTEGMRNIMKACPQDLAPSTFTQSENEILSQDYTTIHAKMFAILDQISEL